MKIYVVLNFEHDVRIIVKLLSRATSHRQIGVKHFYVSGCYQGRIRTLMLKPQDIFNILVDIQCSHKTMHVAETNSKNAILSK